MAKSIRPCRIVSAADCRPQAAQIRILHRGGFVHIDTESWLVADVDVTVIKRWRCRKHFVYGRRPLDGGFLHAKVWNRQADVRVGHVRNGRYIAWAVPGCQDPFRLAGDRDFLSCSDAAAMHKIVADVIDEMLLDQVQAFPGPDINFSHGNRRASTLAY